MTLSEDLRAYVKKAHKDAWKTTNATVVPDVEDLGLGNVAARLDATVLYADLAESTGLVSNYDDWFSAEIYKNYLYVAAKIVRARGGEITAYDGDRIMAVFVGDSKNSSAAKCALQISWAVAEILQPAVKAQYPESGYVIKQKVGIDTSGLFVARTGIRGSNDLVWVGNAANNAAKMAALSSRYASYLSEAVYRRLEQASKLGGSPQKDMWTKLSDTGLGYVVYGSNWTWGF